MASSTTTTERSADHSVNQSVDTEWIACIQSVLRPGAGVKINGRNAGFAILTVVATGSAILWDLQGITSQETVLSK
jgi:hypothetical protein